MTLEGLLLGLVAAVAGFLGSSSPVAAFSRTRDPRFLLVAGAMLALLAVGVLGAYGAAAAHPPTYAQLPATPLGLIALASVLLMLTSFYPRGR